MIFQRQLGLTHVCTTLHFNWLLYKNFLFYYSHIYVHDLFCFCLVPLRLWVYHLLFVRISVKTIMEIQWWSKNYTDVAIASFSVHPCHSKFISYISLSMANELHCIAFQQFGWTQSIWYSVYCLKRTRRDHVQLWDDEDEKCTCATDSALPIRYIWLFNVCEMSNSVQTVLNVRVVDFLINIFIVTNPPFFLFQWNACVYSMLV